MELHINMSLRPAGAWMKHQLQYPCISCAQCNFKLVLLHKLAVCQTPCDVHSPLRPLRAIIRFSIKRQGCKEVIVCSGVLKSSTYHPCCPSISLWKARLLPQALEHGALPQSRNGPPTTSGRREPVILGLMAPSGKQRAPESITGFCSTNWAKRLGRCPKPQLYCSSESPKVSIRS